MKIREAYIGYRDTERDVSHEVLDNARAVVAYMDGALDFRRDQEQFWVILLDVRLRPLARFLCALGTVSAVCIHPREVFRAAVLSGASNLILLHNHPSGDPKPSEADKAITRQLRECGEILGITVLDHIVLGERGFGEGGSGFHSFAESDPDWALKESSRFEIQEGQAPLSGAWRN